MAAVSRNTPLAGNEQRDLPNLEPPPPISPPRFIQPLTDIKPAFSGSSNRTWADIAIFIIVLILCVQLWGAVILAIALFHGFAMCIGRAIVGGIIPGPSHNHTITSRETLTICVAGLFFSLIVIVCWITSPRFWKFVYEFPVKLWVGVIFLFGVVCSAAAGALIYASSSPEKDLKPQWMILNYCFGIVIYGCVYLLWIGYRSWKSRNNTKKRQKTTWTKADAQV
ncbi:hypothetical protein DL96DRAFT_1607729 [Flagelloscypha sp. PMI_526]|nr:hypothetical protein DL96DRAFT_1607729 [Flagelloscypha sp. PMI_526]